MAEHKAIAKENVDIRRELKETKASLKILRRRDRENAERISQLEAETTELREDMAREGVNIPPEAKSYQRLLTEYKAELEKNKKLRKDIAGLKETDVYDKWQTAKSNYVTLRRIC